MGFWAFGYIALTATDLSTQQLTIAAMLAAVGFAIGMLSYLKISNSTKPRALALKEEG